MGKALSRLRRFAKNSKRQGTERADYEELCHLFRQFAATDDEYLTFDECLAAMQTVEMPMSAEELRKAIDDANAGSSLPPITQVDRHLFFKLLIENEPSRTAHEKMLREAFDVFDGERSGAVQAGEVIHVMRTMGSNGRRTEIEIAEMMGTIGVQSGSELLKFDQVVQMLSIDGTVTERVREAKRTSPESQSESQSGSSTTLSSTLSSRPDSGRAAAAEATTSRGAASTSLASGAARATVEEAARRMSHEMNDLGAASAGESKRSSIHSNVTAQTDMTDF